MMTVRDAPVGRTVACRSSAVTASRGGTAGGPRPVRPALAFGRVQTELPPDGAQVGAVAGIAERPQPVAGDGPRLLLLLVRQPLDPVAHGTLALRLTRLGPAWS